MQVCDRDESLLEKRGRTKTPTCCDDLHSEIEGLTKNRSNLWTSDCEETPHLDTCSSATVYIPLICEMGWKWEYESLVSWERFLEILCHKQV